MQNKWKNLKYTQNRERSWLQFNERVLEEAEDETTELIERLRFLSIFDSNLDEFFMIRVGSLYDMAHMKADVIDVKSGMNQREQLDAIMETSRYLYQKKDACYNTLTAMLKKNGVLLLDPFDLTREEYNMVEDYFENYVLPVLSPQIIDNQHPFPHLQNLSLNIVLKLRKKAKPLADSSKKTEKKVKEAMGIVSIPKNLPAYFSLKKNNRRIILLEKIIKQFSSSLFEYYDVLSTSIICVTRNADIAMDDIEDLALNEDYVMQMRKVLKKRSRLAPVRLETDTTLDLFLKTQLMKKLGISEDCIFTTSSPICLGFIMKWVNSLPQDFVRDNSYPHFDPQYPYMVDKNVSITEQVNSGDIFLSYPYESMDPMISLLREAASDPSVISIKITVYRLASSSRIAEQLEHAAENGKNVTALLELRARFDEQNNIDWATRLEDSGCHVIYGLERYKVHSKICLITRVENNNISYITQVGTGNYNEKTAKQYTDFCLITKDEDIGKDAVDFFNNMSVGNLDADYDDFLVAPLSMQKGLKYLIEEEIAKAKRGEDAYIRLKLNSISDKPLIDLFCEASNAGVKIDMLVRGVCCILPGIPGKTENIRIYSIVGRFLEHHRIYCFGRGSTAKIYISSADFMTRNIRNRIEIACPIFNPTIKERINTFMDIMLSDNIKKRELLPTGKYQKITLSTDESPIIAQNALMELAQRNTMKKRAENAALRQHQKFEAESASDKDLANAPNANNLASEQSDKPDTSYEKKENSGLVYNLLNKFKNLFKKNNK